MVIQSPIKNHSDIPNDVPLVADFHDDRNRLSYYYPRLSSVGDVDTPVTKFFGINGNLQENISIEYRKITEFMQSIDAIKAFLRGDFTSAKLSSNGSKIESQDPYDIQNVFAEFVKQTIITDRNIGGRVAVREWIPHDIEVRTFIRNGEIYSIDSIAVGDDVYRNVEDHITQSDLQMINNQLDPISDEFDTFSWSVDFIKHSKNGKWYCIDMGLDGLYYNNTSGKWVSISEHVEESNSPGVCADEMPHVNAFNRVR